MKQKCLIWGDDLKVHPGKNAFCTQRSGCPKLPFDFYKFGHAKGKHLPKKLYVPSTIRIGKKEIIFFFFSFFLFENSFFLLGNSFFLLGNSFFLLGNSFFLDFE